MNIPIFVISLSDAGERRGPLLEQLKRFGMSFDVFDAVDGRAGLDPKFECMINRERAHQNLKRPMTDGEFACTLSHISIYQHVVKEGLHGAIIFEDDARLGPEFPAVVDGIDFSRVDFLQFNYGFARVWRTSGRKIRAGDHRIYRLVHNTGLASAYFVSQRGARYILEAAVPISLPADWPCDLVALRPEVVYPRVAVTPDYVAQVSSLEQERAKAKAAAKSRNATDVHRTLRRRGRIRNPVPWHWRFFTRVLSKNILPCQRL